MNSISSFLSEYACQMSMKMLLSIFIIITISFVSTAQPEEPEELEVWRWRQAVSIDGQTSNQLCRSYCKNYYSDSIVAEKFSRFCRIERYSLGFFDISGEEVTIIRLEDKCYNQWIFGYLDEDESLQVGNLGRIIPYVDSASICQEHCQNDENCKQWTWRFNKEPNPRLRRYSCQLKTSEMVDRAFSTSVEGLKDKVIPPTDERWMWCNMTRGSECNGDQCVKCRGEARCVYKSKMHISGPKWCRPTGNPIQHHCDE